MAIEPDPRILWVADSSIVKIDGFAVHPNGNIFAYRGAKIFEIDGTNGKLIKILPVTIDAIELTSIDISSDGSKLAVSWNKVEIIDLNSYSTTIIHNAAEVKFLPKQNKICFTTGVSGQTGGHDSSIVIMDLNNNERQKIKTEELIQKFAFSPDGRYFATGGIGKNINDKYYTTLKLWDAQSFKLIKELERYENTNIQIGEIQFTQNGQLVGFKGGMGLVIFNTNSIEKYKLYSNDIIYDYMVSFEFYDANKIVAQSKHTVLINMDSDNFKTVFEIENRSKIKLNHDKTKLYVCSFDKIQYGPLIALNMNNLISTVNETQSNTELKTEYQKGILTIFGIEFSNNSVKIEIFDINGKLIRQLSVESNGTELRIPLILTNGTYLLNLTVGNKQYSSKFIVVE